MNKFSLLFLVLCLTIKAAVAQRLDANGIPLSAGAPVTLAVPSEVSISSLSFANSRLLTEINEIGQTDAYPCLSQNGLRVYYTKGDYNLYSTVRNPLDNTFSSPVLVFDYTDDLNSCTISADEKTMIATTRTPSKLIKATRSNLNGTFNYQSEIQLNPSPDFFTSPSFSPDSNELYLFKTDPTTPISRYLRTGNNIYSYDSNLPTQSGPTGPGKLSAEGLEFFYSINMGNNFKIYQWSRSSLNATFSGTPQLVQIDGLSGTSLRFNQPSVSVDKSFIVFVANNLGTWQDNDLAIAFNTTTGSEKLLNATSFTVYPNPATGSFRISGIDGGEVFTLLNIHGQTVINGNLPKDGYIHISTLASGVYTLRILKNNRWVHEKLVKE